MINYFKVTFKLDVKGVGLMKIFGFFFGDNPGKHIELASDYYKKDNLNQAIKELKIALKLDPQNSVAQDKLRNIYREKETLKAVLSLKEKTKERSSMEEFLAQKRLREEIYRKEGERRQYSRMKDERPVQFRLLHSKEVENLEGIDRDISAGGIRLVVRKTVSLGAFLELRFDFPPPNMETIWVIGRVVRVEEIKEEGSVRFSLGIRFTNISEGDKGRVDEYISGEQQQMD
ncbi:MAG: hypothetical protein COS84_04860 [Armatimonadetes bacterium CG07_land_8_20_14_0_80_40_9]|nr:MAG: hypothetical protein COS84_04860 [Armatimonadetes bacterium CG07_land_8_20_14_0_80_40_9]